MVDYGLFGSIALTTAAVWLATLLWPPGDIGERTPLDQFTAPIFVAIVVGRAATLLMSDLAGFANLREFLTVRGGVEFWPGALAALGVLVVLFGRPTDPPQPERVARLAPYAIVALGAFQATCFVRDGCPGSASGFGLIPPGLTTRQFPVGIIAGLSLIGFAWWLRRSTLPPQTKILVAIVGVGAERAIAGAIEPNLASAAARDGISMVIAFSLALGWWAWFERQERQWKPKTPMAQTDDATHVTPPSNPTS